MLTRRAWREMIDYCQEQLPHEACGLLSGTGGRGERVWPVENVQHSPTAFAMDGDQLADALQKMADIGERWVAVFHSHPTAAPVPSVEDVVYAPGPETAYLIVSLAEDRPEIGAYRIQEQHVEPLVLHVIRNE